MAMYGATPPHSNFMILPTFAKAAADAHSWIYQQKANAVTVNGSEAASATSPQPKCRGRPGSRPFQVAVKHRHKIFV